MKLALGTAQFGMPYGITNRRGQVSQSDVRTILSEAHDAGCDTIDTAVGYRQAHEVLGAAGVAGWKVVTKLPPLPPGDIDVIDWVRRGVEDALRVLRIDRLYGLLLHRPADLTQDTSGVMREALCGVQRAGLVERTGVSAISPADLDGVSLGDGITLVQTPFNLFDRRLLREGRLDRLLAADVEVHARSVFLQGLLVQPPAERSGMFAPWAPVWEAYDGWIRATGLSRPDACLADALQTAGVSRIVVGVESVEQWRELVRVRSERLPPRPSAFDVTDERLISPSTWPSLALGHPRTA